MSYSLQMHASILLVWAAKVSYAMQSGLNLSLPSPMDLIQNSSMSMGSIGMYLTIMSCISLMQKISNKTP